MSNERVQGIFHSENYLSEITLSQAKIDLKVHHKN